MTNTHPLPGPPVGTTNPQTGWILSGFDFAVQSWLWGWPAVVNLTVDWLLAPFTLVLAILTLVAAILVPVFLIGLPFLVAGLAAADWLGQLRRARIEALIGTRITARARPEPATWWRRPRDLRRWPPVALLWLGSLWGLIAGSTVIMLLSSSIAMVTVPLYAWALPGGRLAMPWNAQIGGPWWILLIFGIGALGLLLVPLVARELGYVDMLLTRWLLGRDRHDEVEELTQRVHTLTRTREAAIDSVETERRRIERDLHDGPQQRLVAIAMDLGMAQERLARDPAGAGELLDKAHSAAKEAIVEMRQVARGIHPPVLTDRGLDAALSALAARSPVPVTVIVDLPVRPSPTVEAIAYFCVSEALTNVAKHAHAQSAEVSVLTRGGRIRIEVRDDGVGGAVPGGGTAQGGSTFPSGGGFLDWNAALGRVSGDGPSAGTGLSGLADRVAAIDGTLSIDSPAGGPTRLTILLPLAGSQA